VSFHNFSLAYKKVLKDSDVREEISEMVFNDLNDLNFLNGLNHACH
jgi:hypothetical protein